MERYDRKAHPGWAVQFQDGSWLGGAHGWFTTNDAFFADICETKEAAYSNYLDAKSYIQDEFVAAVMIANVVLAWEPLCERLRSESKRLNKTSKPLIADSLDELKAQFENLISLLKETK